MKGKILSLLTVSIALMIAVGCTPSVSTVDTSSSSAASVASVGPDNTTLSNAVVVAVALNAAHVVGTNAYNVPQAAKDTYTNAIAAADAVVIATNVTTQAEYDAALATLGVATADFTAAFVTLYHPDMTTFNYSDSHGDYIDEDIAIGSWNSSANLFVTNDGLVIGITQLLDLAWGTLNGADVAGGFALVQRPDLITTGTIDLTAVSNITFDLKSSDWSAADLKWLVQTPNSGAGAEQSFLVTNQIGNDGLTNADNAWHTVTLNIYNKDFTKANNPVTFLFNNKTINVSQMFIKDITFIGYNGNPVTKAQLRLWQLP